MRKLLTFMFCLFFLIGCSNEQLLFLQLREARRETDKARKIAEKLAKTSKGVELAIDDINCFGGTTRGWSSWILKKSDQIIKVESELNKIIDDQNVNLAKRTEAAIIMWNRTNKNNYLLSLFVMVQSPGENNTVCGRNTLSTVISNPDITKKITAPSTEPIPLSVEEFKQIINDPQHIYNVNQK